MQLADARVSERPLFSERDRGFESFSLQRRVSCEPDFLPLNSRYFRPVRRKETRARRWDLQFESTSLQERVHCELDHLLGAANRRRRHERTGFSLEAVLILWRA